MPDTLPADSEPWPLSIPRDARAKRRFVGRGIGLGLTFVDFVGIAITGALRATSRFGRQWLPGPAMRIPARQAWRWIEAGKPLNLEVLWTRDGLKAEVVTVALRRGEAMLHDAEYGGTSADLRRFAVVELLAADEAPAQCRSKAGERWVRLHSEEGDRLLRTDERQLSLIGRCAGWADPRVGRPPRK